MTGHIIIVKHHFKWYDIESYLSLAIRTLDRCWANHCAILSEEDGMLYIYEARGSGVVKDTFIDWLKHRPNKDFKIGIPKVCIPFNIEERIKEKEGKSYDVESLFIWHPYRLLTGRWRGGTSEHGDLVCSEYVALCYKEYFDKWYKATTNDIIKADIFRFTDFKEAVNM